jgi:hypothetical protein
VEKKPCVGNFDVCGGGVRARAFRFFRAPKKTKSVSARMMNETRESFFFRGETARARARLIDFDR